MSLIIDGRDPINIIDDEDILPVYRRQHRVENPNVDDLSDYVKIRLLIARVKALQKFSEIYYNTA